MKRVFRLAFGTSLLLSGLLARAEISAVSEQNDDPSPARMFRFKNVPFPARTDAAREAKIIILSGEADANGGGVEVLNDGKLPQSEDAPGMNFFFAAGTKGGRILLDLGNVIPIKRVASYSWHPGDRGPQVYKLYGADGKAAHFDPHPKDAADLTSAGWTFLANVDTRPKSGEVGGQHGVNISNSNGKLGDFRYLIFEISRTEDRDPFGNTFFSEIDVIHLNSPEEPEPPASEIAGKILEAEEGIYRYSFDLTAAPDLTEWTEKNLVPLVKQWYPKIIAMLPSEGFEAPTNLVIRFRHDMGGTPASAAGRHINCNIGWFRRNLQGEAAGSVVHEMVHIVQAYGWGRRNNPDFSRAPGWFVEGLADYIRWFLYEPHTKGAEITKNNLSRARYDASYRITGNFLNWVVEQHGADVMRKLNAAARTGKYSEDLWKEYTGQTVQQLGEEWKASHEKKLAESK